MNYTEKRKKQLEIARKIVKRGNCDGINCNGVGGDFPGIECPIHYDGECTRSTSARASEAYIKAHSEPSRKELLERVEKLEKRVDGLEISSELHKCENIADAEKLRGMLEQDILSLVLEYQNKTGLKVSCIDIVELHANYDSIVMTTKPFYEIRRQPAIKVNVNL